VTACDPTSGCITCGDEAVELTVVRIDEDTALAHCESESGETESIEIELVLPVRPGDRLLVHAGTALQITRQTDPRGQAGR
jgi:hydrogenase maturation factor